LAASKQKFTPWLASPVTNRARRTNKAGSMKDGEHEGHPGARIDQVIQLMDASVGTKPNVYLINAGTNDCQQNYNNMKGTIGRMNDLLTKAWDKSQKATIILSTLTPSFNGEDRNQRVTNLNKEIRDCTYLSILQIYAQSLD
jgi:hypothetical protein